MYRNILKAEPVVDKGGEWATAKEPTCMGCKHRSEVDPAMCLAYPSGIPIEILMGDVDHTKPYKGDHGVQFEKA